MGGMNIAYLKAGTFTGQTTGSESRQPSLMCYLRKRVCLIHELGKLTGAKELLNGRSNGLRVDQVVGHEGLNFLQTHTLADGTFHANKSHTILIFHKLTNSTNPPVTKMIDIINRALGFFEIHQVAYRVNNIFSGQSAGLHRCIKAKFGVNLETTYLREIIGVGIEEKIFKKAGCNFNGWRTAWPQATINLKKRFFS